MRLNQVSPARASEFLMSQGATFYRTKVLTEKVRSVDAVEVVGQPGAATNTGPSEELIGDDVTIQTVEAGDDASGALPLRGLTISPDDRLNSITLTGEPNLVKIAEGYLKQIDLRKRQVAVRVQILDVDLSNTKSIDNSFALRTGNSFIVNKNGQMLVNFGGLKPPASTQTGLPGTYEVDAAGNPIGSPIVGSGAFQLPGGNQVFNDKPLASTPWVGQPTVFPFPYYRQLPILTPDVALYPNGGGAPSNLVLSNQGGVAYYGLPSNSNYVPRFRYARSGFGPYNNPGQPGLVDKAGVLSYETPKNFQYPKGQFFDFVSAMIKSNSAKVIADPTLLVQEEETSSVGVGATYFTSCESSTTALGIQNFLPVKEQAGLQVSVSVKRIDDNGFVSLDVSPILKAPSGQAQPISCGGVRNLNAVNLSVRQLKSGEFRVRDGQTLILTGVIQEDVFEQVSKWPILGDLPLVGQFFRSTTGDRKKRELVMVVTPRIVNDYDGGTYGYGYQPSSQAAKQLIYSP